MLIHVRVLLIIEVMEHARHSPEVLVLPVLPGIGAHRCLDRKTMLQQAVILGELGENRPRIVTGLGRFSRHDTSSSRTNFAASAMLKVLEIAIESKREKARNGSSGRPSTVWESCQGV